MKLKKLGGIAIIVTLLVGWGVTNSTYAMELQEQTLIRLGCQEITPLWDNISGISPYISAVGTTLYPEIYIEAKMSSASISGTMYLEKYSSGRWTSVTSWSFKGAGNVFLSKSYRGTLGVKYRTRVAVTVDGETAVATSGSYEVK